MARPGFTFDNPACTVFADVSSWLIPAARRGIVPPGLFRPIRMGRRANLTPLTSEQSALAAANVGLVFFTVRKMARRYPSVRRVEDEALTESFVALVRAARGYDPAKGAFSTYATACIWSAVTHFIRRWFRLPTHAIGRHDVPVSASEEECRTEAYEMARLWLARVPAEEIGEMLGITAGAVGARCRRLGLPPRCKRLSEKRVRKLFVRMWEKGYTVKKMARILGITPRAVIVHRGRMKLKPRPLYFRGIA